MKRNLYVTKLSILALISILGGTFIYISLGHATPDSMAKNQSFSDRSIKGGYGFAIEAVAVDKIDGTITYSSVVGRFTADGKGNIVDGVRTVNLGGLIQEQVFAGHYEVRPDGTGELTIEARAEPPGDPLVPDSRETADLVVTKEGKEFHSIATSVTGPDGEDLGFVVVSSVVATRQ